MCGISNRLVSDYREMKRSGGKLDNNELKNLSNQIISAGANNSGAITALKNEIMADNTIDADEKKLLLTVGFSVDQSDLNQIKTHLSPASDETVSKLLQKGFEQRDGAISKYKSTNPNISKMRDMGSDVGNRVLDIAKKYTPEIIKDGVKGLIGHDSSKDNLAFDTTPEAASRTAIQDPHTQAKFFNDANFTKLGASESTACANAAISSATGKAVSKAGTYVINEGNLKNITGKNWDGVNVSTYANNPTKMKQMLTGQEGKAIVTVGSHTFVFRGFDTQGNLKVTDPSEGDKARLINKNNPSASVFIQKTDDNKGGDGALTNMANGQATAKGLNEFRRTNTPQQINSADRADHSGESYNVRKLLVLMGDDSQKPVKKELFTEMKKSPPDINKMKSILTKAGISLEAQEIGAFSTKMRASGGAMMQKFEQLDNMSKAQKSSYLNGVEYSDISLKDYFTRVSTTTIANTFEAMIQGKDGC